MPGAQGGQKRASGPLEVECKQLWGAWLGCWNQIQVLWRSSALNCRASLQSSRRIFTFPLFLKATIFSFVFLYPTLMFFLDIPIADKLSCSILSQSPGTWSGPLQQPYSRHSGAFFRELVAADSSLSLHSQSLYSICGFTQVGILFSELWVFHDAFPNFGEASPAGSQGILAAGVLGS